MTNLNYLYDGNAAQKFFGKNFLVDKHLNFRIIPKGTALPHNFVYINGKINDRFGGLVDSKGSYVRRSFVAGDGGTAYTPNEDIEYIPKTAIYIGMFQEVWGHALTDNIRRLWFLKSDAFKNHFKNCPLIYIQYGGGGYNIFNMRPTFKRLFEILEIDIEQLVQIKHPTQFENIIIPDDSFFVTDSCFYTKEYSEAIERVRKFALKNQTPTSIKKVYFFYGRNQIGEERLAEYFKAKGYEIISPEKLSLDEQLNILINAESFASTVGSCAHNSIFLREGTEVILIPRVANRINWYQLALDQISKVNETYVDSSLSIFETLLGPYCFIISEQLRRYFGEEADGYTEEDFKIFLTYARVASQAGLEKNTAALPHYFPMLQKFYPQLSAQEDLLKKFGVVFTQG